MISNPIAIKFVNEKVRVTAKKLAELMVTVREFIQELDPQMLQTLGIDPAMFNKAEDLTDADYASISLDIYADGSEFDGRRPIANAEVLAWLRIIRFLYNVGISDNERVEKLARKIAFGQQG